MSRKTRIILLLAILCVSGVMQFYGINKLVLGSDELHPARALMSDDWSLTVYPWPEEASLEFYKDWPMHFPPLFGLATRLSVVLFGVSHFSLRLFPLLFGLAGLVAIYCLYRHFFGEKYALFATALFGLVSDQTITWAKGIKHYTADMLLCSLLLIFGSRLLRGNKTKDWIYFTFTAAVSFWIGYGSVYVIASVFTLLAIKLVQYIKADRSDKYILLSRIALAAALVGVSFLGLKYMAIDMAHTNPVFMESFGIQIFRWSRAADPGYVLHFFGRVFCQTLLLPKFFFRDSLIIAVLANICIVYWIYHALREKKYTTLGLAVFPLLFCIGAAVTGKYPFTANRLLLFLLPSWILMIANGFEELVARFSAKRPAIGRAAVVLAAMLLLVPAYQNAHDVQRLRLAGGRRIDLAIAHLRSNAEDGDVVFLHWAAILGFYFYFTDHEPGYQHNYPIPGKSGSVRIIYGQQHNELEDYNPLYEKVEAVEGRLWIVFSHQWPSEEMLELESRLGSRREVLDEYEFGHCRLVLFAPL